MTTNAPAERALHRGGQFVPKRGVPTGPEYGAALRAPGGGEFSLGGPRGGLGRQLRRRGQIIGEGSEGFKVACGYAAQPGACGAGCKVIH